MYRSLLEQARVEYPHLGDEERVELIASDVVRELDEHPPINLAVVASYRDVVAIKVEPLSCAGSLTREPAGFVIRLRASDSRRRRRFSGFHEVGHTFLPGYAMATQYRCQPAPGRRRKVNDEALSDAAASELLLPRTYVAADLAEADFGLDTVLELADKYDASVQACAQRFVELWPEPALLVLLAPGRKPSEHDDPDAAEKLRLVWARGSGPWPYLPRHKSAAAGGVLSRALEGELVDEFATLAELGCESEELEVSTRVFHYRDQEGELRPQVLALYRRTSTVPATRR